MVKLLLERNPPHTGPSGMVRLLRHGETGDGLFFGRWEGAHFGESKLLPLYKIWLWRETMRQQLGAPSALDHPPK